MRFKTEVLKSGKVRLYAKSKWYFPWEYCGMYPNLTSAEDKLNSLADINSIVSVNMYDETGREIL